VHCACVYNKQILRIVQGLSADDVATIPGGVDPAKHSLVMERKADVGLLLRQRSVSIDEVREQLKRGRPVHREATLPTAAVDYSNFMYGDAGAGAGAAAGGGATGEL
jgi:hypothetical protein